MPMQIFQSEQERRNEIADEAPDPSYGDTRTSPRDFAAIHIMMGIIASGALVVAPGYSREQYLDTARHAYLMADCMMEARVENWNVDDGDTVAMDVVPDPPPVQQAGFAAAAMGQGRVSPHGDE